LILKIIKGGKNFSNKSKKDILVRFESFNNFIVYILEDNKVIIIRDIIIKEELNYKMIYNKKLINNNNNDIYNDDKLSLPIILK